MSKLTKKAIRYVRTNPNYRKSVAFKIFFKAGVAFTRENFPFGRRSFVNEDSAEKYTDVYAYNEVDLIVELGSALGISFLLFYYKLHMV